MQLRQFAQAFDRADFVPEQAGVHVQRIFQQQAREPRFAIGAAATRQL